MSVKPGNRLEKIFVAIRSDDEGRVCKDIPESACKEQPQNILRHILSLSAFKVADGLVDPKLILTWLFVQLGATAQQVGYLVPIREAGALLPQLIIAQWVRQQNKRKWVWASGAFIQGIAFICMALAVLLLDNELIIYAILGCLLIMALARSFCSVSYKDVLGKTISKTRRGSVTGTSSSIASSCVFIFGLVLTFLISEMSLHIIAAILILAGILCFLAAFNFLYLEEQPGSVKGGQNALNGIIKRMNAVLTDKQFLLFLLTRACLVCTAIAPPFILMLPGYAQQQISGDTVSLLDALAVFPDGVSQELGLLILASSLSGTLSSPLWGRLSDNSSKTVLLITAFIALVLNVVIVLCLLYRPELFSSLLVLPVLLFVIMTAHHGVRIGRSTHLVDMSDENNRANYTAVSNTIMGIFLTGSILFGYIANTLGLTILFMVFACLSAGALITASLLKHVQDSD